MPLNDCEITGHLICDTYQWVFTVCTVSYCQGSITVALENRLCKRGAFICEQSYIQVQKLAQYQDTNKIMWQARERRAEMGDDYNHEAKFTLRLLTIMVL